MPQSQLRCEFHEQGRSLHVYGLVLTHISARIAPMHADIEVKPLHPIFRPLLSIRAWRTSFSAAALLYFLKIGPRGTNSATEVVQPQTELSIFISVLYDAFFGMTLTDQRRAQKQLTALMIVATGDTHIKDKLFWFTLRKSAGEIQGREWLENIVSKNKYLRNSFFLVMDILRTQGLSAVRCDPNESLASPGGLAFAGAAVQTGDAVVLVSGVSLPLILRPCQGGHGRFRLVGPLFLPGVMDGELKEKVMTTPLNEIILV